MNPCFKNIILANQRMKSSVESSCNSNIETLAMKHIKILLERISFLDSGAHKLFVLARIRKIDL